VLSLAVVSLAIWATGPAVAQLTAEDIAALQEQGRREGWTFTVRENPATQYSLDQLCGVVEPPDWRLYGRFDPCEPDRNLPSVFDWRNYNGYNYCTPIKNQGGCGSCWAFGLVGAVEARIKIEDLDTVDLSEQWLVSCCGLGGCSGEWPGNAANFYLCSGQYKDYCGGYGAVLEEEFPYVASDAPCGCPYTHPYCLDNWAYIGPQWGVPTVNQIKQAIMTYGPVTVCVNATAAFQAYGGGIFNACDNSSINHAVALVGWDDSQGPNGVWFLRNSWGAGWGESGYMRITYNCCLVGYGGLYVNYAGRPPTLVFSYPQGVPEDMPRNQPASFQVQVTGRYGGTPVANSGQLHYSLNGGSWVTAAMTQISPGLYQATLPAAACLDQYRWYVSVAEATVGRLYDPPDAPASYRSTLVLGNEAVVFSDNFQVDRGWTVQNAPSLTGGAWERGVPAGGGERGDPPTDFDGSGACFLTGNEAGDSDVDGGPTRLISPLLDMSDGRFYRIKYARWFYNDDRDEDRLTVEVSNNGGATWQVVQSLAHADGWVQHSFTVSDYVPLTSQMRVRFSAVDNPNNSITEAGLDAFKLYAVVCGPVVLVGDLNCDGQVGFADINPFVLAVTNLAAYLNQYPDCPLENRDINGDGQFNFGDINSFVALLTQ